MSGFIKSPFGVVTEYENEFIEDWRLKTAKGLSDVIRAIENGIDRENIADQT